MNYGCLDESVKMKFMLVRTIIQEKAPTCLNLTIHSHCGEVRHFSTEYFTRDKHTVFLFFYIN